MDPFKTGSVSPLHDPPESQSPPLSKIYVQYEMTEWAISGAVQLVSSTWEMLATDSSLLGEIYVNPTRMSQNIEEIVEKNVLESMLLVFLSSTFLFSIMMLK